MLLLVKLSLKDDGYIAKPLGWGSNLMLNLSKANGYVTIRAGSAIRKGDLLQVTLLGASETLQNFGQSPTKSSVFQ